MGRNDLSRAEMFTVTIALGCGETWLYAVRQSLAVSWPSDDDPGIAKSWLTLNPLNDDPLAVAELDPLTDSDGLIAGELPVVRSLPCPANKRHAVLMFHDTGRAFDEWSVDPAG